MKPLRATIAGCIAWLGMAAPAQGGWQNVFQVTCFGRHAAPAVSYYAPPADPCAPCPPPMRWVQRCYYQPQTTYQTRTYYEPVTTYRTSYYCEPVTSYRYTCHYDPCTCSYRQVATPYTSYRLRSQCCPVTSFVQRCCTVPVTTQRKCCYWALEPCPAPAPVDPCPPNGNGHAVPAPGPAPGPEPGPGVTESRTPPTGPNVQQYRNGNQQYPNGDTGSPLYERNYRPSAPPPPEGSGSSLRHRTHRPPTVVPTAPPARPQRPIVPKLDRIALDSDAPVRANLVGLILSEDGSQTRAGIQLTFVNDGTRLQSETATADKAGKFKVRLTSGAWSVYAPDSKGQRTLLTKLTLKSDDVQHMTLVSR